MAIAKVQILCSIGQIGKSQRVNIFIYSRETSKVLQGHTFVNGLKKLYLVGKVLHFPLCGTFFIIIWKTSILNGEK